MKPEMSSQNFGAGVKILSRCPICHDVYNSIDAKIIGSDGDTRLLHVRCNQCANSLLALVMIQNGAASSVGLVTDLSYEDVLRFKRSNYVNIDDVIGLNEQMSETSFITQFQA